MCGIVGYIGNNKCIPKILCGLESLEYRGYDSAGIAYVKNNNVVIKKEEGRIANLKSILDINDESYMGIGHTRWATHGKPCTLNSHPHRVGKVTIVHNGILENYASLREELGYEQVTETDSEIVAAYINKMLDSMSILDILKSLKDKFIGSYALGIIIDGDSNLYAIRHDSPLILGVHDDGNYIASDVPAILSFTNKYYLLLNDEYAVISNDKIEIYNDGILQNKELLTFEGDLESAMKNGYEHFMLKEIYEQPKVIQDTIKSVGDIFTTFKGLEDYDAIDIVGCGSAYHVGLVGKYLISKYGNVMVNADIASEYRYTDHVYLKKHLIIVISQSGETADTLAVLRKAKEDGVATLALVNVVGSSIAREADSVIYIKAGVEVAVATTKAYICQLIVLSLMASYLGIKKGNLDESILLEYNKISNMVQSILDDTSDVEEIANLIYKNNDVFYLGRKSDYAIAMEASLKLKEISYKHSEAYAAGELKHGTISLVEDNTPVISIVLDDIVRLKTLSNIKEVCSRGALSIIITDTPIEDAELYNKLIYVPKVHELLGGILAMIKCQLIAYYVAKLNGCDIDKPRNLAKSVTVE